MSYSYHLNFRKKFNKCSGKKLPQCIMYIQKLKLELQHFLLSYFRETDTEIGPKASTKSKNICQIGYGDY